MARARPLPSFYATPEAAEAITNDNGTHNLGDMAFVQRLDPGIDLA